VSNSTNCNVSTQRLLEGMKFAYVANARDVGNPFLHKRSGAIIRDLTKVTRPAEYDPSTFISIINKEGVPVKDYRTSQMVTPDESGLVVSLTSTVNLYWGAQIMVRETGSSSFQLTALMNSCIEHEKMIFLPLALPMQLDTSHLQEIMRNPKTSSKFRMPHNR
jgi:Gamma-glutamyltranspeptidase